MNMNQPFKYEFNEVKFYEYTIRMTVINNTKMYAVTDLLKQYNKINNTDKRINNWLKRDDTRELLQFCRDKTHASCDACENNEDDFIDIPEVIIKIDKFYNNLKAYLVNGAILHDILIWVDKVFAYKVYNFLDNMREINNDRFVEILNSQEKDKQIELLQEQVKRLQNRYIVNKNSQQWTYVLKIVKGNDGFYDIYSTYTKSEYEKENIMNREYYVRNIPNGYTFRYFIYEHLLPIIDQYNGVYIGNHRSHFKIQENLYDENDEHLDYLIRNAIDQTINELCWKI